MNILRSTLAVAVAAVLGMPAAHAFSRADYAVATKVYFGGATATDNVLEATFIAADGDGICDSTKPIDIWRSTNQRVITCVLTNDNPVTAGKGFPSRADGGLLVAFHKESVGGSSNGVVPLIAVSKGLAHSLRWLDVGSLANDCTVSSVAATVSRLAYTDHASCTLVTTPADTVASSIYDVHGGISDNEPALAFPAPGKDAANLVSKAGVQIVFGVPVSVPLYRALQIAQLSGSCVTDTDPLPTVDTRDAPTCVPSLEKGQVSALVSQNITSWADFTNNPPAGSAIPATALPSVAGVTAPADTDVRICRRVATSGTQAAFEAYFLNQRCAVGVQTFAAPDDASSITDTTYKANQFALGSLVNAAPSSGNVRTCIDSASANNYWAIGVLSTEVKDTELTAAKLRFVGINGYAPTLANVANGKYDFVTENTVNYIKAGKTGALATSDARFKVVDLITARLANIDALNTINADFDDKPWGNGGILALPSVAVPAGATYSSPYTAAMMAVTPISTVTRGGNTCSPTFMVKRQPLGR